MERPNEAVDIQRAVEGGRSRRGAIASKSTNEPSPCPTSVCIAGRRCFIVSLTDAKNIISRINAVIWVSHTVAATMMTMNFSTPLMAFLGRGGGDGKWLGFDRGVEFSIESSTDERKWG